MVEAEWKKVFYKCLNGDIEYDFFCIDFLEERFDIMEVGDGFITLSDAVMDVLDNEKAAYPVYSRNLSKVYKIWKEKCDCLIRLLKNSIGLSRVILVRSYLMEWHGKYGRAEMFENIDEIRKINRILDLYYTYFEEHAPGIKVIDMRGSIEEFSDEDFKHGCAPWHTNEAYHYSLSDKIGDYVGGNIRL